MKNKLIRLVTGKRGQLHIAETLIASTIMLVLALSFINVTVNISEEPNDIDISNRAWSIIEAADSAGMLKPVVYLEDENCLSSLEQFITVRIPLSFGFSLERVGTSSKVLISAGSLSSADVETYKVNYYLSGYASLEHGIHDTAYNVVFTLYKIV